MKKLYLLLLPGIGILLGIYSFFAAKAVRGIGVYTMSSGMGQFLSVSRHYTAAVSIVLILLSLVILGNKLLKKRGNREEPKLAEAPAVSAEEAPAVSAEEVPAAAAEPKPAADAQVPGEHDVPKCAKCGAVLKEDARFCEQCGAQVPQSEAGADPVN